MERGGERGTTQAPCPAGMHQSWGGRLNRQGGCSRQRRGWKLCQGRMPRVTQRYEASLYGVPSCPSHEPSPGPSSYFPLWNQTLQSRERKSMVRNNLTVCHRGMPMPGRVEEACSSVYQVYVSLGLPLSVSALSVCKHALAGKRHCSRGVKWSQCTSLLLRRQTKGKNPDVNTGEASQGGHLQPFPLLCASLCTVGTHMRLPAAVGGMRKIIKMWSYGHSGQQ